VKHIFNFRGAPAHLRVQRLVSKLSSSGTKIPSDFLQQFLKAEAIFFHHLVFNPQKRACEFLVHERHPNCFPDIVRRAKESLGIASPADEVDLTSAAQLEDLHAVATSTTSFLGQVRSREVVEQIYKGQVCPRTLRSLSESSTAFESGDRPVQPPQRPPGGFSRDDGDEAGDHSIKQGFATVVTRREVSQPSPAATARQVENKKRAQERERAASLQRLMGAYKTSASREVTASAAATTVIKSTKVAAVSMKDLVAKHAQSVQASTSPVQNPFAKPTPQSAPESRKRPRPAAAPVASSARKARTLAHKTPPGNGKKTLFDFFQKQ
jgi:hypothetical protein